MESDIAQRRSKSLSIERLSDPQTGRHQCLCSACKTLIHDSNHGHDAQNCSIKDCYICAEISTIDDEISGAYEYLYGLIQKRTQMIKKDHEPEIHRLPVELLSTIFIFVKEACYADLVEPSFQPPYPSPPLRVGSVCRKWREITLRTPHLWTDFTLNLMKPADAQLNLVNGWAHRSGCLPLNITLFLEERYIEDQDIILNVCKPLVKALRLLAFRWNDLIMQAPWSFYYQLLNELEEPHTLGSLHMISMQESYDFITPIKLKHPLRPKRFHSQGISAAEIPLEWNNLTYFEISYIQTKELLHIIRHAHNLRHCITGEELRKNRGQFSIPTTYITNRSLIHLRTSIVILGHLTLPSLQHLEYSTRIADLNPLIEFVSRSIPPFQTFILRHFINRGDHDPCFAKLPGITFLALVFYSVEDHSRIDNFLHKLIKTDAEAILPRLKGLKLALPSMRASSWSLLSTLFRWGIKADTADTEDLTDAITLSRSLSQVHIFVYTCVADVKMDKDTFLRFLAARESGVDLDFRDYGHSCLFMRMAELYDVNL